MLDIIRLYDSETKKAVARGILEALPECSCTVKYHKKIMSN